MAPSKIIKEQEENYESDEIMENSSGLETSDEDSSEMDSGDENEESMPIMNGTSGGRKAMMEAFAQHLGAKTSISEPSKSKVPTSKVSEPASDKSAGNHFKNKQRVMLLASRGISYRYRHLLKDLEALLPHSRKDSKFDEKGNIQLLTELADLNNCNNTIYFEVRKKQDLYMWMAKTPHGPTMKFLIQNVHTMDELKMTGNCLKGSRPLLSFDSAFDTEPQFKLMKQMFIHFFGTPKGHRKSKPFFDHVISFSILDGKVWFRHFQIIENADSKDQAGAVFEQRENVSLVEIGPRFVMNPIRMFDGSFGGPTLYENPDFISPNAVRAQHVKRGAANYVQRQAAERDRELKKVDSVLPRTELDDVDDVFRK